MLSNLQRFKQYCENLEAPDIYIEYAFYSLIAACLQRRVWYGSKNREIFPNLYIIFVGRPGSGKSIAARPILKVIEFLRQPSKVNSLIQEDIIHVAPNATTAEALIYKLAQISDIFQVPDSADPVAQAAITFVSEELGNLFKQDQQNLITFLTEGFDCGDYRKETKHHGCDYIKKMCINMIGATNPEWLAKAVAFGIIGEGLASRVIFIAGGEPPKRITFFDITKEQLEAFNYLVTYCRGLTSICGPLQFTEDAYKFIDHWYTKGFSRTNPDKKLDYYYGRKKIHVIKLAMCIHFADTMTRVIERSDIEKALELLARTELNMHEAFNLSGQNSTFVLSQNIMSHFWGRPVGTELTIKHLLLTFFRDADVVTIGDAVKYLTTVGKLEERPHPNSDLVSYKLKIETIV